MKTTTNTLASGERWAFKGYLSVYYTPIAGTERVERFSGSVSIGDPNKPLSGGARRLLDRAKALAQGLRATLPENQDEFEVGQSVVRFPLEFARFKVTVDERMVELAWSNDINPETRDVAIDSLPPGLRRLVDSITTTLERMAWEDFRKRLDIPTKEQRLQVFISYRKTHETFAEGLAQRLGREGLVPWFDKWDILAGDSVPGKIEEGLRESVAFIPIITADYQQGAWATEELQSAITKRIETDFKIIPILLENCERPELIRHLRYVDFAAHDPETFESKVGELIDAIYGLTLNPFRE